MASLAEIDAVDSTSCCMVAFHLAQARPAGGGEVAAWLARLVHLVHRARQFLAGGGDLADGRGDLGRRAAQSLHGCFLLPGGGGDLRRGGQQLEARLAHPADDGLNLADHGVDALGQLAHLVAGPDRRRGRSGRWPRWPSPGRARSARRWRG